MNIKDDDLAVIGMSGRFPGANNVAEFWDNICAKKESIRALSDEELRAAGVAERDIADPAYVKAAALLGDVDRFDPGFFKMSPLEAELMDPQIRLLLQCAWETLEDAGHASKDAQNIGVFAGAGGVTTSYFANYVNRNDRFQKITAGAAHLGNDKDFLATYISYKLNLTGPSVTVQTACSTSLVALHQARLSLLSGECDMALAGGVTVRVPHVQGYQYKDGYIFSRSGRISSFDEDADGVVFGSGMGLVLLKRLSSAIADGDNIHAVITGSAIMNDGKGKMSYAASSARGQIACVRAALAKAGVPAASIGFVESHGTGTAMGDPEEVKALSLAFKEQTEKTGFCALGAVKANIGHLEAAAGIAGFIKAVMAVKHGLIPPTARFSKANSRIKFEQTPFFVNTKLQQWHSGKLPRRAAVNSLGVGGTNAFVILENYVAPKKRARKAAPVLVPLSAKNAVSLRAGVQNLADFLARAAADKAKIDIADLAYTLQAGREAMDTRTAFVVSTLAELQKALLDFVADGEANASIKPDSDVARMAAAWVAGEAVDWSVLHTGPKPTRISLPTYAFAKDLCWIAAGSSEEVHARLHPLVHANMSDLSEQKYSASFSGEEFFLNDHQVRSGRNTPLQKVLPGVAYLEMARAALAMAAGDQRDTTELELRDVVWLRPIAMPEHAEVHIALAANREGGVGFEVFTGEEHIHCQGRGQFVAPSARKSIDVAQLASSLGQGTYSAENIYQGFDAMGLAYGPAHRVISTLERGQDQLLATLALPDGMRAEQDAYVLHPSMMDGALQAATVLLFDPKAAPAHPIVPFAIEGVRIVAPCTGDMLVWARRGANAAVLDIDLLDAQGKLCVEVRGFAARALGREATGSLLATPQWQRAVATTQPAVKVERHVVTCGLAIEIAGSVSIPLGAGGIDGQYSALAIASFEKLQAIMLNKPQSRTLIQLVLPNTEECAVFAGLTGMFRTATLENPLVAGQIVMVDAGIDSAALAAVLETEAANGHDTLVRYASGQRFISTWRIADQQEDTRFDGANPFKEHGIYLITGGLGGLGLLFAGEILARASSATVILTGRAAAPSDSQQALLASLRAGGKNVEYRQLDLEDRAHVEKEIASIQRQFGGLHGIFHSAGMTADAFILKKSAADFGKVFGPKVAGTVNLDHATRALDLDFVVLFSSLSSALGNLGQADYAAANGFLEQFAGMRNRQVQAGERRGATVAIAWPLWEEGGMQPHADARAMLREAAGIDSMKTATGMRMFYRSLARGVDHTLVMEGHLRTMRSSLMGATPAVGGDAPPAPVAAGVGLTQLAESYLGQQLSALLKLSADQVDPATPLADFGIDSIVALDLTRVLENSFGALPKTLFFEYLTIRELAAYFVTAHAGVLAAMSGDAAPAPVQAAPAASSSVPSIRSRGQRFSEPVRGGGFAGEAIAIVGLSGRYPQARDLQAFWNNLRDGKDCIVEVPSERWDWRDYYSEDRTIPGRHYSKWGGFIEGVDEFDARFFNISPLEAVNIDPQERLFLQHAWMAMEDAGYTRASLQVPNGAGLPAQVGVYAGVMYGEYQLLGAEASLQGKPMGFASNLSSIANRVSFALNLHGPSMAVDTMCSSSLTAIHLACQDLKLGRTTLGIAGGVNVTIHPNKYLMLSSGQFISGDGHCQSFGEGGDGYIPGEGVGVVILKRLSDAQRDGNPIYGVIRGSALSHGGRTNGYTVPNPQAQASAIRQAFDEAGVDARHVSYIEAHGTGTKLGDPIEIAALSKVFQENTQDSGFCQIGSAKSNIGHCEAAAGIAGLTKVLLQLKHKQIVPSLHSSRLNPHIDFARTPFVVNQALRPWEKPVVGGRTLPRIAGISSFGAGGSNAHLVIEEYEQAVVAPQVDAACIVPVSARTAQQLREKVSDLAAFFDTQEVSLAALAVTLQSGREAMDERLAVVADSMRSLTAKLRAWLDGTAVEGVWQGQAKAAKTASTPAAPGKELSKMAELWANGVNLDWSSLRAAEAPKLVGLPTYPFARKRYWVDVVSPAQRVAGSQPLPHTNTSDHSATVDGEMLANAESAFLKMARAAIDLSMPAQPGSGLEFDDVALAHPLILTAGDTVSVALFDKHGDQAAFEIYSGDLVHCQGRAIRSTQAASGSVDIPSIKAPLPRAAAPKALAFARTMAAEIAAGAVASKPAASIMLTDLDALPPVPAISNAPAKPLLALGSMTPSAGTAPVTSAVSLFDHGDGVFAIRIDAHSNRNSLTADLIADLLQAMRALENAGSAKVLMIEGSEQYFLSGALEQHDEALTSGLYGVLAGFACPVIAVVHGLAEDAGFLFAALCDFMVCSEAAVLRFALPTAGKLLRERFGSAHTSDFLREASGATGADLKAKGWTFPILPGSQVSAHATELAVSLSGKSQESLKLLKQHLGRHIVALVEALSSSEPALAALQPESTYDLLADLDEDDAAVSQAGEPATLSLKTGVITAVAHPDGILEVRMADRDARNMFSDALSDGLREVFALVAQSDTCKVVVLTGYDNYFSSGGTPETLRAIHQGSAVFTENLAFQLPLACPVPVIAAMQGHGIGAGWALGMYADFALFSDESRYFSPYMGYGFTPGAGATLVFPKTMGYDLARETLLTAREYSGGELKERGMRNQVLPRDSVVPAAMALARRIAASSRSSLLAAKLRWAEPMRSALGDTFERELAMHARTFVGQADTLARIEGRFQEPVGVSAGAIKVQAHDLAAVTASLKQMLAHELRMEEADIGEDEQFVDLGLDSITGVTWVRRVNDTYGTAIEAIKVYSYPTLAQLARLVQQEAPGTSAVAATPDSSAIVGTLRALLAHELRMEEGEIGEDEQFVDLGLDSITGVTWIRRVNELYGTAIEAIKVYSYPTLVQLAGYVGELVGASVVQAPAPLPERRAARVLTSWRAASREQTPSHGASTRIAVIGMAGQFAKANNLEQFWTNIAQGVDCIEEVPRHRWDIDHYFAPGEAEPGKTYSRWMGALEQYDLFDAAFFNISPREARNMDPQQRLFLQACWHGIEHAGYNPKALGGSKCGVFVGCSAGDYHQLSRREQLSGQGFTGGAPSILAARISYFLDLHGPSLSIDTACSSSLVAFATACDSLASGASDIALAGGVNVMATPAMQIMTSQVGMLSPQGRCFTFDQRANGIANGEGVGVVMLKRLADAQRDGDCIYGVVEGWGVNQDGKTNGITAPNAESQTRLQQQVYDRFGINPAGIGLIEAHGTGTALGDPIEVAGLKSAFAKYTTASDFCALGSVKSNIGHCLNAAGISGLLKALLCLKHRQLPPTIHFQRLNEHISLQDSPFYISERLRDWTQAGTQPRRAAINAFGFSGTNAHVVIAEYREEQAATTRNGPVIVPLSARTAPQLLRQAQDLRAFIGANGVDLHRLAHTLQVGREPMNERAAFVVASLKELDDKLAAFIASAGASALNVFRADVASNKQTLQALGADQDFQAMIVKWIGSRELTRLADLWVKGLALDWTPFYAGSTAPRRMALPVYPFALERFWIDAEVEPVLEPVQRHAVLESPAVGATAPVVVASQPSIALDQLQRQLKASLADALFMQAADVDVRKSFTELGLDSIIGVEWMKVVNKEFGTSISATRVYDYPSLRDLAGFIHAQMVPVQVEPAVAETAPAIPLVAQTVVTAPAQVAAVPALSLATLQQQLSESLADALFMQPSDIDPNRSFTELGLDSIIGVEWVKAINKRYGSSLSATRVYDYPSVKELAGYLAGATIPVQPVQTPPVATPATHGAIRFDPKYGRRFKQLYFYSADGEGDFDAEGEFALRCTISPESNVCLEEHVVFGAHLLPTDAYIELVYSAFRTYFSAGHVCLRNIAIVSPILGAKGRDTHLRLVFRRAGDDVQFFVRSAMSAKTSDDQLHMQGSISLAGAAPRAKLDHGFAVEKSLAASEIPTNSGVYYAPLKSLQFGASAALGQISVANHRFSFVANPFVLYGGLCTVINFGAHLAAKQFGSSDDQFLPHRIGNVTLLGALDDAQYRCYAEVRALERDSVELYFEIVDAAGKAVAVIDSIGLRRVARSTIEQQLTGTRLLPATSAQPRAHEHAVEDKVAIIGMSCRFPMSDSADAFWRNLTAGNDCVVEVPEQRWGSHAGWFHPDPRNPNTSYSKWAGLIDDIDHFDALFFGIAPSEAELIDPQQRIFLQECWKTIESAGYAPGALTNQPCGVYVGCAGGDYGRVLAGDGYDTAGAAFMGTSNAILAARISYYLNLKGPALAVDTACSSSLVAVHLACASIRSGENQLALAGGINLLTTPIGHILTSQVGMPSRDGRCATFDASANGIVFSEGCGVLLLKSLRQAERDNDHILGVIEGSGTNQDGKTNGITAPSSKAQEQLLRQVYDKFDIDPKRISYIEAHGTATPLGDPIEVNALAAVYGLGANQAKDCALGSVKSNIGHTGFAAGVAGIVKVLLCLKHRKLVPSIHYHKPNPHIEFDQSPFFVNTEYRDWVSAQPRMASVSSFGFSGTNAHVVIGEHAAQQVAAAAGGQVLVPLSAKAGEQLRQKVSDLLDYLGTQDQPLNMASLAYTLQAGRDAMDHRLAFIAGSAEHLAQQLQGWLDGKARIADVHQGQASRGDDMLATFADDPDMQGVIARWISSGMLTKVAELWVRGFDLDWNLMYRGAKPARMTLPTYPFAKERCWVTADGTRIGNAGMAVLHPLLHRNTSDLAQQSYTSVFSGSEFFLDDHRVGGQAVLPAVAYLEMARAALADALPGEQATQLELRHVAWSQPIVVTTARSVVIAVFSDSSEQAGFEVYSQDGDGTEILHCQGSCAIGPIAATGRLDLAALRGRMRRGRVEASGLYPAFADMGLHYGPSFRGIVAVERGDGELLVELSLPPRAQAGSGAFVLNPSMLDSALQGSISLIGEIAGPGKSALPFALESLRIMAPCTEQMTAWVRHVQAGAGAASGLFKMDIDLCDSVGNICVQMRGFSSRPFDSAASFDEAHYQSIIAGILSNEISIDEALESGNL